MDKLLQACGHGNHLLLRLIKGRWMMAVVSLYILLCSGGTYIFGIYSGAIKSSLHYNQETINTISFYKDLGANVGIVSGLMNEILPSWTVLGVGSIMNLVGYLMVWLAVTDRIMHPPLWQMNIFIFIGANSQTFANTGVLINFVKSFPHGRGEVLGIPKGCVGLSGAVFTQLFHAIYGQDTAGVILLIGWLPTLVTLMFMVLIRPMAPVEDKRDKQNFYYLLYLALLLAAFLTLAIVLENLLPLSPAAYQALGAITLLLVISNIGIGIWAERGYMAQPKDKAATLWTELSTTSTKDKKIEETTSLAGQNQCTPELNRFESAVDDKANDIAGESGSKPSAAAELESKDIVSENEKLSRKPKCISKLILFYKDWPKRGEDFSIPHALLSLDMWILFTSVTCGVGTTLTAIDNMGQIGESLGYSKVAISTFVSLISIWNFLGRVISGFVSEMLLRRYNVPRPLMLTIVLALSCVSHILIAFPSTGTLYIASVIVGLCFGAQWPIMFAVVSELFGLKHYATLYNVAAVASPVGSYFLNVKVAGYLYDRELQRQHISTISVDATGTPAPAPSSMGAIGGNVACMGPGCFRITFVVMTIVCACGSLVSLLLVLRTRKFYSQDIYAKFHAKAEGSDEAQDK